MQLQHVNVKLLLQNSPGITLEPLIPVFHSWIERQNSHELLIDVADYSHVPAGPGVVLIGHQGNYSVDNTDDRLGVRYNRKAAQDGGNQNVLAQATRAALTACQNLEAEPRLEGKFRFNGHEIEFSVNDRMIAPNSVATIEALDRDFQLFSEHLFRGKEYSIAYDPDSRALFKAKVKAVRPHTVEQLLGALS